MTSTNYGVWTNPFIALIAIKVTQTIPVHKMDCVDVFKPSKLFKNEIYIVRVLTQMHDAKNYQLTRGDNMQYETCNDDACKDNYKLPFSKLI